MISEFFASSQGGLSPFMECVLYIRRYNKKKIEQFMGISFPFGRTRMETLYNNK